MVVIITGLPGSGKSYFGKRLANALQAAYLNSDQIRKTVMAKSTYSKDEKISVYDKMLFMALELLPQQENIVIDATFYTHAFRKKFADALQNKTDLHFIEIKAEEWLVNKRLQHKRTDSEADFMVYQIIKSSWEPFRTNHLVLHSTSDNLEAMLHQALVYLKREK